MELKAIIKLITELIKNKLTNEVNKCTGSCACDSGAEILIRRRLSAMNLKKVTAVTLAAATALSLAACGSSSSGTSTAASGAAADTEAASSEAASSEAASSEAATSEASESSDASASGDITWDSVTLGETGTDLNVEIKLLTHRTDMMADDYAGKNWNAYLEEFNKMYPGITVNIEAITDYANDSLLRLQAGGWGDIMMIPAVDKADLPTYFISYGDSDTLGKEVNYINNFVYQGQAYGIPSTANANGIVYNKKVFEEAGITELPKTPDEFIADLQKIKDNTDAIPLYTNYAAGWTMGAWDAYISGTATGDPDYMNYKMIHTANPFAKNADDENTYPYAVYKILYDAVANGLIEDDYTTTDWEGCKGMINNGEIGCMVLGSWAVTQMQGAGPNADDIGYMPFPITVNGKQYASAGPDYNFGISAEVSDDEKLASMIFVKWFTLDSGFSYNEGGLPIAADDTNSPDLYQPFTDAGVEYVADNPAPDDEADLPNEMNSESELAVNAGGNEKVQSIVEHAFNGDEDFDSIMDEWNQKWSDAQDSLGVEIKY